MTNFITAVSNRRTNYTLSKDVTIPQETITKTIEDVIREVPSAFNMQSGKAVIAFGDDYIGTSRKATCSTRKQRENL